MWHSWSSLRSQRAWARLAGVFGVGALLLLVPTDLSAQALAKSLPHVKGARKLMLDVIESVISQKGDAIQFLGQGSWLKVPDPDPRKPGYKDVLTGGSSDIDIRTVIQSEGRHAAEKEAMRRSWLDVRDRFIKGIDERFAKNANNLAPFLESLGYTAAEAQELAKKPAGELATMVKGAVNLYPPNQIVETVATEAQAATFFKKLGAVPSLAGKAPPEGVWGPGKTVTVQELESFSRARLFYMAVDERGGSAAVKAGFADLVHMAEGNGFYTREGAANMAHQWIAKATEAAEHGDVRLVAKYLDRVGAWLKIAKNKGGLPPSYTPETFAKLDAFYQRALGQDAALAADKEFRALLTELQLQTELLYKMSRTAGEGERAVLQAVLTQEPGRWAKVSAKIREVAPKMPEWANASLFIDGTVLAISAYLVPRTAASESIEAAYRQAGVDVAFLAGLAPGFAALFTNLILEDAKALGYALAVQQQDWDNFLNGISQVKGFEGTTDLKGMERNIDDLALKMTTKEQVQGFVRLQAYNISQLNTEADAEKKTRIAEELEKKFMPVVLGKWQKRRNELMADALEILPDIEYTVQKMSLRVDVSEQNVKLVNGKGSVTVRPSVPKAKLDTLARFVAAYRDAAMRLGGAKRDKVYLTETYRVKFTRDGKVISEKTASRPVDVLQPLTFDIEGIGVHNLSVSFDVDVKVTAVGMDPRDVAVSQPLFARVLTQTVNVDVAGMPEAAPSGIGMSNEFEMEVMIPGLGMTNPNIVSRKMVYLAEDDFHWEGRKFVMEARWKGKPFCLIGSCSPKWDSTRVHVEGEIDSTGTMLKYAKSLMYHSLIGWSDSTKSKVTTRMLWQVDMEVKNVPLERQKQDYVWEGYVWGPRFPGHLLKYTDHRMKQENITGGQNSDQTTDFLPRIDELRVRFKFDPKIRNGPLATPPTPEPPAAAPAAAPAPAAPASQTAPAADNGGVVAPVTTAPPSPSPAAAPPKTHADSVAERAKASVDSAAKDLAEKAKAAKEALDKAKKKADDLFKGLFKKKP